jgi:hypothetical protein
LRRMYICKDTYISIYTYTYSCTHTYIYTYSYIDMHVYIFFIRMSTSLPFLYRYRYRYISCLIEGVIHMMYGLCAGGALTRTVEPPNKASVPRCILGPRWVHTAVPSRVRHAACRALRAVRWLLRCCVACNWLRCMLRNDCGARCIMASHANAARRMQRDASCVLLLHVASTSSVSSPSCAHPSRLPACSMLCVACCSAECMVRVATCCTALQPVAMCCAGLRRVATGCMDVQCR